MRLFQRWAPWGIGTLSCWVLAAGLLPALTRPAAAAAAPRGGDGDTVQGLLVRLWGGLGGAPPATPLQLLWRMALADSTRDAILARADTTSRALTDTLLSTLLLTVPEARRELPQIYVARDDSPPPDQRPPSWTHLRQQGLGLLRVIAPDPSVIRDRQLLRDLDRYRASMQRATPSEVAGLVLLWQAWWADRGDVPAFYVDPSRIPAVDTLLGALARLPHVEGGRPLAQVLYQLQDAPLRWRLFRDRLDAGHQASLVAECITILRSYQEDLEGMGLPPRGWDPQEGRSVGVRAEALRGMSMEILARVTDHLGSGVDENQRIVDWLSWWRRARFQARYYRDPREAPSLGPWLAGLDRPASEGGQIMARFLRQLYLAYGFQDLLLEQIGPQQHRITAELIEWLRKSRDEASAAGFQMAHREFPLRPVPGNKGVLVAVRWPMVQELIRDLLRRVTGEAGLSGLDLPADTLNGFWWDWWLDHAGEAKWYRTGVPQPPPRSRPRFTPETGRLDR